MQPTPNRPEGEKSAMTIPELARRVGRSRQLLHRLASDPEEGWPTPGYPAGTTRPHYDVDTFDAYWAAREAGLSQGKRNDLEQKRSAKESSTSEDTAMGYDQKQILISARVSRHNSEQDQVDDGLFDDLANRIRQIVAEPQYESIEPNVDAPH